jgi:hypothetical protein
MIAVFVDHPNVPLAAEVSSVNYSEVHNIVVKAEAVMETPDLITPLKPMVVPHQVIMPHHGMRTRFMFIIPLAAGNDPDKDGEVILEIQKCRLGSMSLKNIWIQQSSFQIMASLLPILLWLRRKK